MRVFAIVCAVVFGMSLSRVEPAFADIDASKIEKAREKTLTPTFQEDLPGHEVVQLGEFRGGGGGGGGSARQGSGSG
nr:hypothetical protein [Deltaproteobacteria bacterium]